MAKVTKSRLVDFLISNEEGVETPFTEEDRETLDSFNLNQLESVAKTCIRNSEEEEDDEDDDDDSEETTENTYSKKKKGKMGCAPGSKKKKKKVKADPDMDEGDDEGTNNTSSSLEDWLSQAPVEVREVVENACQIESDKKSELIDTITENGNNVFSADELRAKPVRELKKIAAFATNGQKNRTSSIANYLGASGGSTNSPTTNSGAGDPLERPTMTFED